MPPENNTVADDFSFLDLSDEELLKLTPEQVNQRVASAAASDSAASGESTPIKKPEGEGEGDQDPNLVIDAEEEDKAKAEPEPAKAAGQAAGGGAGTADAGQAAGDGQGKTAEVAAGGAGDAAKEDQGADAAGSEAKTEVAFDYKAAYEKLMAPFKANGHEIQVKTPDEAVTLMQMGANYNKKMAGLKPHLTLLKLLENNGLLDEQKLSYLIDLDKKDPGAINKLIKDSGLDPMDLDAKKGEAYTPTSRSVDPREVELDQVLEEIQATETGSKTIEVVGKAWDVKSRQVVADNPQVLKLLNAQMASGVFDLITSQVARDRVFGMHSGLSDIEAYKQVGDAMNSRGDFNSLGRQEQPKPAAAVVVTPKPVNDEEERKNKKRAAAPSKPATPAAPAPDFNPLALSDEEFAKLATPKYVPS